MTTTLKIIGTIVLPSVIETVMAFVPTWALNGIIVSVEPMSDIHVGYTVKETTTTTPSGSETMGSVY